VVPENSKNLYDFVPHMVDFPKEAENLKKTLKIPNGATVFGYYGGSNCFDIKFAKAAVEKTVA
jgi:hypothetical protein